MAHKYCKMKKEQMMTLAKAKEKNGIMRGKAALSGLLLRQNKQAQLISTWLILRRLGLLFTQSGAQKRPPSESTHRYAMCVLGLETLLYKG